MAPNPFHRNNCMMDTRAVTCFRLTIAEVYLAVNPRPSGYCRNYYYLDLPHWRLNITFINIVSRRRRRHKHHYSIVFRQFCCVFGALGCHCRCCYSLHMNAYRSHELRIVLKPQVCRFCVMVKVELKTSKSDRSVECGRWRLYRYSYYDYYYYYMRRISIVHWAHAWNRRHTCGRGLNMFRYHFINWRQFAVIMRTVRTCPAHFRSVFIQFKLFHR